MNGWSWSFNNLLQGHSLALLGLYIGLALFVGVVAISFKGSVQV